MIRLSTLLNESVPNIRRNSVLQLVRLDGPTGFNKNSMGPYRVKGVHQMSRSIQYSLATPSGNDTLTLSWSPDSNTFTNFKGNKYKVTVVKK